MTETLLVSLSAAAKSLHCMDLPETMLAAIRATGYRTTVSGISGWVDSTKSEVASADIVLLDVTAGGQNKIEIARRIRAAISMSGSSSFILCFSTVHRNPRFVLELTKAGARYVRVSDPAMLTEAIELVVAEGAEIESAGPCFHIRHRFSRGFCAPGEEIAVIELVHHGDFFQLPLALSARFMFNHLAENRSFALDAFQIASGLNGWFYRDHGLNAGLRQTTKVRVATVKVLAQRIRQAMTSTFAKAGLAYDPYDVLRSFAAEGSTRALYRLHADVRWQHRPK